MADAGLHVREHRFRSREVNHGIDNLQSFRRKGAGMRVILPGKDLHPVSPLARDFFHERAGLAMSQKQQIHRQPSLFTTSHSKLGNFVIG